jgi:hypothetical protein
MPALVHSDDCRNSAQRRVRLPTFTAQLATGAVFPTSRAAGKTSNGGIGVGVASAAPCE